MPDAPALTRVDIDGEPYLRISNVDQMAPFFMSVAGSSDVWLFAGSNSPFTAGRVEPDRALFPYQTVDKILAGPHTSGARTVIRVGIAGRECLWEPWLPGPSPYRVSRSLDKHVLGCSVRYEEANHDLGLAFSWDLAACDTFGLVRRCRLSNMGEQPVHASLLDGWNNLIAPGVTQETYARLSYLVAGYMRHEAVASGSGAPIGLFTLNAALTDRAEPVESLRCAAAWCVGLGKGGVLLSSRQVDAFRLGERVTPETEVRGAMGAYLATGVLDLAPGGSHHWTMGADTRLDPSAVLQLQSRLADPVGLAAAVEEELRQARHDLWQLVGMADGLQLTADEPACAHHFANALFNCMRGGAFDADGRGSASDVAAFVRSRSVALADRHAGELARLPVAPGDLDLQELVAGAGDDAGQLGRILSEYLPLTFSRRHGDPSRPWNSFAIKVKDDAGKPLYGYQGNWRDIFQNWEALGASYPEALPAMVAVFLNASTADGYNPYRLSRGGIDWEVVDPGDVWGHIGYWGDHQVVYLLRLLQALDRTHPGWANDAALRERRYAYAEVPYELAGLRRMLADPRHTIAFNHERHAALLRRAGEEGGDGKLLHDTDGSVQLVTLAEKLLVPILAKLGSLVPGGGIWLNTQRPEWNDANNALAGWGLSVVTACYMRGYLRFLEGVLARGGSAPLPLSAPVAEWMREIADALADPCCADCRTGEQRLQAMVLLGSASERYRASLYAGGLPGVTQVPVAEALRLVRHASVAIDATILANLREDGLAHSYNVLETRGGAAAVKHLGPMLEGQVAMLSSGLLDSGQSIRLLSALRASAMYRPDQHSYMLYPDRVLPSYLHKNRLPDDAVDRAPVIARLERSGDLSVVVPDCAGGLHFCADLRNAADLAAALDGLGDCPAADRDELLAMWEEAFRHGEFTGRSGTFFMFEGLGSIYWHMVAKLLVAVQECHARAVDLGEPDAVVRALADRYHEIRDGLGYRKSPAEYGAFPTDPYSHTPRHLGAQQPGMTGQVKEELLTRWGELGVSVRDGAVRFEPRLLARTEFLTVPSRFAYVSVGGTEAAIALPAGALAFTCCGVPVVYRLGEEPMVTVVSGAGEALAFDGCLLPAEHAAHLHSRDGAIKQVEVVVREQLLYG